MAVTNRNLNTASLTNREIMAQTSNPTWDEATFTWDAAGDATWDFIPGLGMTNRALHAASLVNRNLA